MEQMQERLRKAQEDGRDLSAIRPIMEELKPLIDQEKFQEAQPVLDRLLETLGKPDAK